LLLLLQLLLLLLHSLPELSDSLLLMFHQLYPR